MTGWISAEEKPGSRGAVFGILARGRRAPWRDEFGE